MSTKISLLFYFLITTAFVYGQKMPATNAAAKTETSKLKPGSYLPGVIYIKLKPGFEQIAGKLTKTTGSNGNEQNVGALSAVGKKTKTLKITRSFERVFAGGEKQKEHNSKGLDRWLTIQLAPDADIAAALKAYSALDEVALAEPSYKRTLFDTGQPVTLWTPNDSAYYLQWNFNHTAQQGPTSPAGIDADIDLPEAWNIERGKPQVIVAIMDSGIDTTHPDIRPNLWIAGNNRFGYNWNNNSPLIQPDKHGTHVAGVIGAVNNNSIGVSGVAGGDGTAASGIRLMNMQIFGPGGTYAGDEAVANAFVFAADKGASIAQNSWGGGEPSVLITDAIDYFIIYGGGNQLNGGIVFFASGNDGSSTEQFPASYAPVIAVGATDYSDARPSYSQYGTWVDISAPGGDGSGMQQILSTINGKTYGWMHGTSMACPHVSGVAALCISKAQGLLTNSRLKNILLSTTDNINALNPAYPGMLGTGRLNALKALQATILVQAPARSALKTFSYSQTCGALTLKWSKNDLQDNVLIAESDSLVFGEPAGNPLVGDVLAGGGKIIYKGAASSFNTSIPPNQRRYFQAWSYAGTAYSFPKTLYAIHTIKTDSLKVAPGSNCIIPLSWADDLACDGDSVLILANSNSNFATPAGMLATGTVLPGGAKVIFKGKGGSFNYPTDLDSTIYFQKWNFGNSHEYVNPYYNQPIYAVVPNAIASFSASAAGSSQILLSWQVAANSCFTGTQYLLAYSANGVFGTPAGAYSQGDSISGGGRVIYLGSNSIFTHAGLLENTGYCYKVWVVKNGLNYSFGKQACTTTLCASGPIALPFTDGFEGKNLSTPDVCNWQIINNTKQPGALKIVTTSTFPDVSPVEGNAMIRFYSYEVAQNETARLNSTAVSKGVNTSMDVRFRWYQDSSGFTDADFAGEGVMVQWSTDRNNWQNLEFYPRVPVQGKTGWSYKQLTLPNDAKKLATVYVGFLFVSKYGHNCYLDDLSFRISSFKPSDNITSVAVCESTDSSSRWTNYYDINGNRLLSIKKNGQNIGKTGEAGFDLRLGPGGASNITATGNYRSNPGGWLCSNRYYSLTPVTEPTDTFGVRYYFWNDDINALATAAASLNPPQTNINIADLYGWKITNTNGTYNVNPISGHTGILKAGNPGANGFSQYPKGSQPDTSTWFYATTGNNIHQLEYVTKGSGGGGIGIGSTLGKGALQVITYTFNGNGNWSNSANWQNGVKPPALLPNNGWIIVDPVAGGECVLDVIQTVPSGASIEIKTGKKLLVKAGMLLK